MKTESGARLSDRIWEEKIRKLSSWFSCHAVHFLILASITVVQVFFISQKEGYHMDELLSYELANAQFNPWIVPTQPQGRLAKLYQNEIRGASLGETLGNFWDLAVDVLQNRGSSLVAGYQADVYEEPVWITGREFHDYITVEDDAFNYLSVYFNVKDDNHPPLHFMALHTVSSLMPGKAVPFMGCGINLVCVLGCCILLMKLGRRLGAEKAGLAAALLYGLSSGGIATVLLIRMYGMMTFWCVASLYLHVKKWQEKSWDTGNRLLIFVTVMGFWTQYFFLFYCIGLAAVTAALLIRGKEWKGLKGYIRSMVTAAGIGLAVFPFAVSDVFSSGRGVEALGNLANGLEGYGTRLWEFGRILLSGMLGSPVNLWILTALLLLAVGGNLLLRFKAGKEEKREGFIEKMPQENKDERRGFALMLTVPAAVYFLLAARMSPYLVDRYIMAVFPFTVLIAVLLFRRWLGEMKIWGKGWAFWIAVIIVCLINVGSYSGEYLYKGYEKQLEAVDHAVEQYDGLSCICIYDGVGYYENLMEFTHYEETLLLTPDEFYGRKDRESILQKDRVVLLLKRMEGQEEESKRLENVLREEYGLQMREVLVRQDESPYGDLVMLFGR